MSVVVVVVVICAGCAGYGMCKTFFAKLFLSTRISWHLNMDFKIFFNVILNDLNKLYLSSKTKT